MIEAAFIQYSETIPKRPGQHITRHWYANQVLPTQGSGTTRSVPSIKSRVLSL